MHMTPICSRLISIVTLLIVLAVTDATSQTTRHTALQPYFGLYGGYRYNIHAADFKQLPDIPRCCENFSDGSGSGISIGAFLSLPFTSRFSLQLRTGYAMLNGELSRVESTDVAMVGGNLTDGNVEHLLAGSLSTLSFEPALRYQLFRSGPVIHVGMEAGFFLGGTFEQSETLISPSGATFSDGRTVRGERTGDIPDISGFYGAAVIGAGYPFLAGSSIEITPEIMFGFNFTDIVQALSWNIHSVRAGVSIAYLPTRSEPKTATSLPVELSDEEGFLDANITASGLDRDGNEIPAIRTVVEEFISTNMRPILNYVFFDGSSSKIPERYFLLSREDAAGFREESLFNFSSLLTYYHLLNIVGQRLNRSPSTTVTITGCNADRDSEKNNLELSQKRAKSVRNYLRSAWNIEENRIQLRVRNLPEKRSTSDETDGIEENRRVEITTDTPELLYPVVTEDTLRRVDPPVIRFKPSVIADADIRSWSLIAYQEDVILKRFTGEGDIPEFIEWEMDRDQEAIPRLEIPLEYKLLVRDSEGHRYLASGSPLPIEQITLQKKKIERIEDKEIDRYSLILFDVGSADLGRLQKSLLERVQGELSYDSDVQVTGYTDRLGPDDLNLTLSTQRALNVAFHLGLPKEQAIGVGESDLLYDNTYPEARFYCRTVQLLIETPVHYE